jgi:uncharacterized protein
VTDAVDYRVISADSHVIEPPDLWQERVETRFRDRAPRLVHEVDSDVILCDQATMPPIGLFAGCAKPEGEARPEGRWEADVPRGAYDPDARLVDIALDGVDAEVLYPTLGMQLYPIEDLEFQWSLFRAYNSWLAESFCQAHPRRFKGIAMLSHADPDRAVEELERAAALGLVGGMLPLYPGEANPYHHLRFDRLWAASVDLEMPVHLHAATTGDRKKSWHTETPTDQIVNYEQVERVLLDLILSGVFDRFPALKVVSAENDAGWAGCAIERADYYWRALRGVRLYEDGGVVCRRPPGEYFRENVRLTFMRDRTAVLTQEVIGDETLMWGSDFPHLVSTWPRSQQLLDDHLRDQTEGSRARIVRDNARRVYRF